jgi:hypothetical protein
VRDFRRIGSWDRSTARFAVELTTLPADADAVAVLLHRPHQGAIEAPPSLRYVDGAFEEDRVTVRIAHQQALLRRGLERDRAG